MNDWWFCVLGTFCLIPIQQVFAERSIDDTETSSLENQKCNFWRKMFNKCPKKEIRATTPPPVSDDSSFKNLGFSFSAFIITLVTSLAVALAGAFACWCCRSFCRNHTFGTNTSAHSVTVPTYNSDGMASEALVGTQIHGSQRSVRRQNSLPPYRTAINSSAAVPVPSAPVEEPPPSYASLFSSSIQEYKS